MKELYEEKIKKLKPKNVKKCLEIIQSRKELNIQINLLNETFQKKNSKENDEIQKNIIDIILKMKNMSEKIDIDAMNNNYREVKEEFTKYLENKLLELGF